MPSSLHRSLAAGVLAGAVLLLPTVADAKPRDLSGIYAGKTSQKLSALDEPYTTAFVLTVYQGRVASIVASVRMECPAEQGIRDRKIFKSFRTGTGPRINGHGAFNFKVDGVEVRGTVTKKKVLASSSASAPGCDGQGTITADVRRV